MHPLIAQAKQDTEECRAYLLNTFSFVPEDKLTWSPGEKAKNSLQIVAHCAVCNLTFADILVNGRMQDVPIPQIRAERARKEAEIQTREAAIQAINESCAMVQAGLDQMSPAQIEAEVWTPGLSRPMSFFLFLPARHMDGHTCQINFLQTCWGDMEFHF